jgi:hypothetical protein
MRPGGSCPQAGARDGRICRAIQVLLTMWDEPLAIMISRTQLDES